MLQKSRIYTLLGINTLVLYVIVLFLLPVAGIQQAVVLGIAALLMAAVPSFLIHRLFDTLTGALNEKTAELRQVRDKLESVESKLAQVTTFDDLTGCFNRRHFVELIHQHSAMSTRGSYVFTVAVSQVDQFVDIVDVQGLGRGHEVLQLFARIVKAALREVDVIARIETDKFGLLLSGCSEEDALDIINRVSQLIGQIQVNDADDIKITASGGLTSYHGTESPEELIEHADQALAFAVSQGRDAVAGYNYKPPGEEQADSG